MLFAFACSFILLFTLYTHYIPEYVTSETIIKTALSDDIASDNESVTDRHISDDIDSDNETVIQTDIYDDIDSDLFPLPQGLRRISRRIDIPAVHRNDSGTTAELLYEQ
jgi:hypothetical protein